MNLALYNSAFTAAVLQLSAGPRAQDDAKVTTRRTIPVCIETRPQVIVIWRAQVIAAWIVAAVGILIEWHGLGNGSRTCRNQPIIVGEAGRLTIPLALSLVRSRSAFLGYQGQPSDIPKTSFVPGARFPIIHRGLDQRAFRLTALVLMPRGPIPLRWSRYSWKPTAIELQLLINQMAIFEPRRVLSIGIRA
jgi:hypothetical protein